MLLLKFIYGTGLETARIILLGIKITRENSPLLLLLKFVLDTGLETARIILLGIKITRENSPLSPYGSVAHFTRSN